MPFAGLTKGFMMEEFRFKSAEEAWKEMEARLRKLYDFTKGTKNVHLEVKNRVRDLTLLAQAVARLRDAENKAASKSPKAAKVMAVATQTDLLPEADNVPYGKEKKTVSKKSTDNSKKEEWAVVPDRLSKAAKKKKQQVADVNVAATAKSLPKPRPRRVPSEVIKVTRVGGTTSNPMSYANVLRAVHSKASSLEADVTKIRRNGRGDLLLHLRKGSKGVDELQTALTKAAGEEMAVLREGPTIRIVIRGLDEGVVKSDVEEAIRGVIGDAQSGNIQVSDFRNARDGTYSCLASVPHGDKISELMKAGRIKIGLVRCHVREWVSVRQCFRCLNFGHIAFNCSGPDRSKACHRCGQGGHVAAACSATPWCTVCDAAHPARTSACPAFRAALKKELTRR